MKKGRIPRIRPFKFVMLCLRSIYRTYVGTVAAVNALVSIDFVLCIAFGNAGNRTLACANTALNAIVIDCVSHSDSPHIRKFNLLYHHNTNSAICQGNFHPAGRTPWYRAIPESSHIEHATR